MPVQAVTKVNLARQRLSILPCPAVENLLTANIRYKSNQSIKTAPKLTFIRGLVLFLGCTHIISLRSGLTAIPTGYEP